MQILFTIPGTLPSLNEFLAATKQHRRGYYAGNGMKRKYEQIISAYIPRKAKGLCVDTPCVIRFKYYEPTNRRDPDNISGVARKFILDALVKDGVLKDDSRKYIKGLQDEYYTDKKEPRIEVIISDE